MNKPTDPQVTDGPVPTSNTRRQDMLRALSAEHRDGLAFAEQIAQIARSADDEDLARGVAMVDAYNRQEMEAHLQHEEQTIFGPLVRNHRQYVDMCVQLGKEHGFLRSLVERMRDGDTRSRLAEFAQTLKNHTLLEEEWLFPVIESMLTDDELQAVLDFEPLSVLESPPGTPKRRVKLVTDEDWLAVIAEHHATNAATGPSIVLFPRYQPELAMSLAEHLDLAFFDLRQDYLQQFGVAADRTSLTALDQELRDRAARSGFVCHNIEALLCVKTEQQRRSWLRDFLTSSWPNPVVLPITVFQGDVPEDHPRVCDLELFKLPYLRARQTASKAIRYAMEKPE